MTTTTTTAQGRLAGPDNANNATLRLRLPLPTPLSLHGHDDPYYRHHLHDDDNDSANAKWYSDGGVVTGYLWHGPCGSPNMHRFIIR